MRGGVEKSHSRPETRSRAKWTQPVASWHGWHCPGWQGPLYGHSRLAPGPRSNCPPPDLPKGPGGVMLSVVRMQRDRTPPSTAWIDEALVSEIGGCATKSNYHEAGFAAGPYLARDRQ